MELRHTFTVPAPIEQAWSTLLDVEGIAPCFPGASLTGVDGDEFSGTVRTAADRFTRQQNAEKSRRAVERAVKRGVIPFPNVPPPLRLTDDRRAEPIPEQIPIVNEALRMRADGATVAEVRTYLAANGIRRSYHGVIAMLAS